MLDYDAEKCCSNESRGAGYPKETNNNRVRVSTKMEWIEYLEV